MLKLLYILQKEFTQIFRTKEMLIIIFGMPLIQMLLMGFAVTTDVKHVRLVIADQDRSTYSQQLIEAFSHTDRFDVVGIETNPEVYTQLIHGWKAQVALIIPAHFSKDLVRLQQPSLQVIADGLDGNSAAIAVGNIDGILSQFAMRNPGLPRNLPTPVFHLVRLQERMVYNDNLNSSQYMVPGIIVILLTVLSLMMSSMNLVREKELGTLEQLLVTPLQKHQLLLGKLIPFLLLGIFEMMVVLVIAQWIFNIHMQGSYLLLGFLSLIYLFTTLGFGLMISTITNTQQQSMFLSWFVMIFMILLSGLFVPIENMPQIMQKVTLINPMRYFIFIMRSVFEKGSSLKYLWQAVLPMAGMGLIIFTASVLTFRKRIK
jgi:ABC-2 type transport system permease protein